MTNQLSEAVRSLLRAKEKAVLCLKALDRERLEVKSSIKSLDSALRTLRAGDSTKTQQRMTAPTTVDVTELITDALRDGKAMTVDELNAWLTEELRNMGKSSVGLKLRITQALRDRRFVDSGSDGVKLNFAAETRLN